MKHEVPHDLDLALAKKSVEKAFEAYSARFVDYNPTLNWAHERRADVGFSAKGIKMSGSIEIHPKTIGLELNVPFVFRIFKNRALKIIEDEISKWVGRAKAGEL